jgi:hypothetical protein
VDTRRQRPGLFLAWLTRNAGWSAIPAILWHGTFNLTTAGEQSQGLIAGIASVLVIVAAVVLRRHCGPDMVTRR